MKPLSLMLNKARNPEQEVSKKKILATLAPHPRSHPPHCDHVPGKKELRKERADERGSRETNIF